MVTHYRLVNAKNNTSNYLASDVTQNKDSNAQYSTSYIKQLKQITEIKMSCVGSYTPSCKASNMVLKCFYCDNIIVKSKVVGTIKYWNPNKYHIECWQTILKSMS